MFGKRKKTQLQVVSNERPMPRTLEGMFEEIDSYDGQTYLHQSKDGTFSASVSLPAPHGCEMKVESGFRNKTRAAALEAVILRLRALGDDDD